MFDKILMDFILDVLSFSKNHDVVCFDNGIDAFNHLMGSGDTSMVISESEALGMSGVDLLSTIKGKWN